MRDEAVSGTKEEGATDAALRAILCDLDGCLISGDRLLPGARELAEAAGDRFWIVSNNSSDTAETLSARLAGLGLEVPADRILLAGVLAVEALAEARPGARVSVLAAAPLRARAEALGLTLDDEAPEALVLGRDVSFDYAALSRAVAQLHRGAKLVVANGDGSHPGPGGEPVPETGSLLAAVLAILPGLPHEVVGKPGPALFDAALSRAGVGAAEALFVGDNPDTDGAGARAAGLRFALVAPGRGLAELAARLAPEAAR